MPRTVYHSGGFHHLVFFCEIHKLLVNILVLNSCGCIGACSKSILSIFAKYLSKYLSNIEWFPSNFRSYASNFRSF